MIIYVMPECYRPIYQIRGKSESIYIPPHILYLPYLFTDTLLKPFFHEFQGIDIVQRNLTKEMSAECKMSPGGPYMVKYMLPHS